MLPLDILDVGEIVGFGLELVPGAVGVFADLRET